MASKNPAIATLAENIKTGVNNRIKELHTSMPGIVQSFDAEKQTASVQPAIRRVFITRDGTDEILTPSDLPVLINVPIQFPRGGGFSLTFPVKKGDECLLVFAERSIDAWHKFGGVKDPAARRFHSLSDATAFVGLSSIPNKVPNYDSSNTQLKKDDGSAVISLNSDSSIDITSDDDVSVDCTNATVTTSGSATVNATGTVSVDAGSSCSVTAPTISLNGNVNISGLTRLLGGAVVTGSITNNGTNIGSSHTHPQGPDSNGDSQQNTGSPV